MPGLSKTKFPGYLKPASNPEPFQEILTGRRASPLQVEIRNPAEEQGIARDLFQSWSKTSTSYMTLQAENRLFVEREGQAYLAYRLHLRVAITVGDPIGTPVAVEHCIAQFRDFCNQQGWLPVFFAIENTGPIYQTMGFKGFQIAEDAYLNLAGLQLKGKGWQNVRTALNRAKREQIEFRRFDPGNTSTTNKEVLGQIEKISTDWLSAKKLPELGFMLGAIGTIFDPAVQTFYAMDKAGLVQGFVSWLPRDGAKGWSLDLMRGRREAMPGLMEFLIASSALHFQAAGYASLALGAAPLAPVQHQRSLSIKEKLLSELKPYLNHFYAFSNLYNFKRKFQPTWKPLYLYYPAGFALPRVIMALLLTYFSQDPST